MELIRGHHNLRPRHRGCVATIGNFDGVHLGHQAVLGQLAEKSVSLKLPSVVITFEPQPQEYFAPASAPPRLTGFRAKMQALHRYAADRVFCLHFDGKLASMPAEEFIRTVILEGLGVRYLVVGDDFRFGRGRAGSFGTLQAAGSQHGFQVVNMPTFRIDGERVSSTWVRDALAAGDLATAAKLLGRPYRMCGRVAHGDKRGRIIGFPTANIHLHRCSAPLAGVYAVEVYGLEAEPLPGVANIGNRPTVGGTRTLLEVHLLDFRQDIYGRHVSVDFMRKLREERRFSSFEALREQILRDASAARAFFAKAF
jgi:riboflavin kinase / FMN adenylyltransferase